MKILRSCLTALTLLTYGRASAESEQQAPATNDKLPSEVRKPAASPRILTALTLAFPSYTHLGSTAMAASSSLTIADRFSMIEAIGVGYAFTPKFRFLVYAIFSEAFTGIPSTASKWQLGALSPRVGIRLPASVTLSFGPIYAYRFGGQSQSNYGGVVQLGRAFKVGGGFTLTPCLISVNFFKNRYVMVDSFGVNLGKAF